jgi:protease I
VSVSLDGKRVAILVMDNFEQVELTQPKRALEAAGAKTTIISLHAEQVVGMNHDVKGERFDVDLAFDRASADDFDAVLLPGGVFNADEIRTQVNAQKFVQDMVTQNKPVAVICHGAWLLVSAGLVKGRTLTSWPSLEDDIVNAGGTWVNEEVHVDGLLISSRKPDDIPAFVDTFIDILERQPVYL